MKSPVEVVRVEQDQPHVRSVVSLGLSETTCTFQINLQEKRVEVVQIGHNRLAICQHSQESIMGWVAEVVFDNPHQWLIFFETSKYVVYVTFARIPPPEETFRVVWDADWRQEEEKQ